MQNNRETLGKQRTSNILGIYEKVGKIYFFILYTMINIIFNNILNYYYVIYLDLEYVICNTI